MEVEAEWVAVRVEMDPDVVLGLVIGEARAAIPGMRAAGFEVVYPNLEMHHHLLLARFSGPDGRNVYVFYVERQSNSSLWIWQLYPVSLVDGDGPSQQSFVEAGECGGIR